ncbi:MAG: thiamine phosphate synthase [Salibacteraceae bacterium]
MKATDWSLMFVTDDRITEDLPFLDVLEASLKGGVTVVQLREKSLSTHRFYQRAVAAKQLCDTYRVPLLINDRVDIALAIDAAGIHIGQSDLPVSVSRQLLGEHKIIGWSVSNADQAMEANKLEVDYIGLSPVFATATKTKDLDPPLGIEGLKELKAISNRPIVCIGGINEANAASLIQNGSDGLAVVSAISQAKDPEKAAKKLTEIILHNRTNT